MRLIDVDELRELYNERNNFDTYNDYSFVIDTLDYMPTIEAEPVRHGKWIVKSTGGEYFDCCSECGYVEWDTPNNYCPNCGAKMGEDDDKTD